MGRLGREEKLLPPGELEWMKDASRESCPDSGKPVSGLVLIKSRSLCGRVRLSLLVGFMGGTEPPSKRQGKAKCVGRRPTQERGGGGSNQPPLPPHIESCQAPQALNLPLE